MSVTSPSTTSYVRGSVEFLRFTLEEQFGEDITTDLVEVTLAAKGADPLEGEWVPGTHVEGTRWRTTDAVDWSADNLPERSYRVFGRLTDSPEIPLALLGTVYIH